ncbi:MAG: protein-L-isoaspartate O-methyltransferase [Gammaproteobacteria bacterium]|nr:protein-L-isoaspartate O-methyltransferase [Gammaproteobacteria bacterium]
MEFELARFNMIEQQIRPWEVLNQDVLSLMQSIPREAFVPESYRSLAYADIAVPLAHDQVMIKPTVVARMLQSLRPDATDIALEIGTGSGYVTALLARRVHHVDSVDIFADFTPLAQRNLAAQGIHNVTCSSGDAAHGWGERGRYDVIALTGSVPVIPDAFLQGLNRGGRLFAIVGQAPVMEAQLITRVGPEEWSCEALFETELPMLLNAAQPGQFIF